MLFEKMITNFYRRQLFVRNDNADGLFYFSPEDFPGLQVHPYSFRAKAGHLLQGCFYHYGHPLPDRVLVFDHGLGNGHRAYMREIEVLAKAGFLVFSYDHTGCMASGGEGTNGFAQSLSDLDACLNALKREPGLSGRTLSVMGHSWGGFSTMNIAALHPEITHVVSMSGFVSVERILEQVIPGLAKAYRKTLLALERGTNPVYADFRADESLRLTNAKVLLVYSADDSVVSKALHFDLLQQALAGQDNIRFLLVDGKDHNPTYTADAVAYKNAFFTRLKQQKKRLKTPARRQAFMSQFDWQRMTAQDEAVWSVILEHLKES